MEKLKYAFYTIMHPADGFYEIRHRGRGSVPLALVFVFLFGVFYSMNKRYGSFVVNEYNPRNINILIDVASVFMLYILFCISNWSITCLMDGKGRLKDIAIAAGYSLLPLVILLLPATLFSQIVASGEEAFYIAIMTAAVLWFIFLLVIGIMTVHNYTLGKMLFTAVLTFAAMLVIIFMVVLLITVLQQLWLFLKSIYTEIVFSA